jgi:hypothetical protein
VPTTLGAIGAAALIIALYMWLPAPSGDDPPWGVFVAIVVISLVYIVAGVWSLFRIQKSRHPARTGITLLALMITAIIVIFSLAYLSLSVDNPANFNVPLDKISALYFTMTILTTVGFGDIHAQTHPAMIAVMVQMVISLTLITTLAKVLTETSKRVMRQRMNERNQAD